MKLNTFDLISYSESFNEITLVLNNITMTDALTLDNQTLTIYDEEENPVKVFIGYSISSIGTQDSFISVKAIRKINDSVEQAIAGIEQNISLMQNKVNSIDINSLQNKVDTLQEKVNSIDSTIQSINNSLETLSNESAVNNEQDKASVQEEDIQQPQEITY